MTNFESPDYVKLEKIEKIVFIDKKIEKTDESEANIQFTLDLMTDYRNKLIEERNKQLT